VNQLWFEPTGRIRDIAPHGSLRALLEPSVN
jgi:hypothetical protein